MIYFLYFADTVKMLCARGLLGHSKSGPNKSMYGEMTGTCTKVPKSKHPRRDTMNPTQQECLVTRPPQGPRTYHPNVTTTTTTGCTDKLLRVPKKSKGMKTGRLAATSKVGSGFIAMSPWSREVVRRSQQSLDYENKENSVISHASSIISRTTSLSSVHTMVSSVSRRIGRLAIRGKTTLRFF